MSETSPVERTPEVHSTTRPSEIDELRRDVAAAVLADPGVLRLEPTLATMVRAWSTTPAPDELVRLVSTGGVVDVALHLAVQGDEARLVAHRARAVVRALLAEHGHVPGSVEVSVLTVEPVDDREVIG